MAVTFHRETRFAIKVVRAAGHEARASLRPSQVETKSSFADLRTATDVRVEAMVSAAIRTVFPTHAVIGEETSTTRKPTLDRPTWFVDPIDGTTNYVHGIPHFACNVALWAEGAIRCGATLDIGRRRLFWASTTRGARVGRIRLRVSRVDSLAGAVVSTGFPYDRAVNDENNMAEFAAIVPLVQDVRRLGCAGLDMAWVAAGWLDGYWERGNGPWDWAAGALLVRQAGGMVTTYDGQDWRPGDETLVASNGRIHGSLLEAITSVRLTS